MSDQSPFKSDDFTRAPDNPGALVNVNNQALELYKKAKKRFSSLNKVEQLEHRVDNIEKMLQAIWNKLNDSSN